MVKQEKLLEKDILDNMDGVALDTNILVDLALVEMKEKENLSKRLKRSIQIGELYLANKISLIISNWTLLEYRALLQELFLELKLFNLGFHMREFSEAKRVTVLSDEELEDIESIINNLKETALEKTYGLDVNLINNMAMKGIEFIDAILIFQAQKSNCKYFVTRDNLLLKNIKKVKFKLCIVRPEQFLNLVE